MTGRPRGRSSQVVALALALGLTVAGRSRPAAAALAARQGRVQFVTEKRVYLDRGSANGLVVRQAVQLIRNGRPMHKCTVDLVSAHAAVCHAAGARAGDLFRYASATPEARPRAAAELPGPLPDEAVQQRAEAIAQAPHDKLDFVRKNTAARPASVSLGIGVTFWSGSSSSPGPGSMEQVDGQLHRIRLGETDLRLDAAFTAMRWQNQSGGDRRFRPDTPTQFYLWEAEVSRREIHDRTVLAVGRIWPWHLPGVAVIDGLQVGRRNLAQTAELGAYGGLIPSALALAPSGDSWAGGVYGAFSQSGARNDRLRLVREELRFGFRHSPTVGLVGEGEALADMSLTSWGANAGGRVRYASEVERQPVLEQGFAAVGLHLTETSSGWIQVRYAGVAPEQQPLLTNELPALRGGYHASLNATWAASTTMQVALFGSTHVDRDSGLDETEATAELRLPRFFGDSGGFWIGAGAAEGWLRTRSLYFQMVGRDLARLRLTARLTGTSSDFITSAATADLTEIGGYLQLEAVITDHIRMRARGLARVPVRIQGSPPGGDGVAFVSGLDALFAL
jgi:hypothetical protein